MKDNESSKPIDEEEEFLDASDHFPFYDCVESFSEELESGCSLSISAGNPNPFPRGGAPSRSGLRFRKPEYVEKPLDSDSKELSELDTTLTENELNYRDKKEKAQRRIRGFKSKFGNPASLGRKQGSEDSKVVAGGGNDERSGDCSTVTGGNDDSREDSRKELNNSENHDTDSSLLSDFAGIIIKLIGFQIYLFVKIFMFPVWSVYCLYMVVFDPFGLLKHLRGRITEKIRSCCHIVFQNVWHALYEWLKEHQSIWKLGLKCGWGLLWSAYVCIVLIGLLLSAFVVGGILISMLIEEPIRINRSLNFNYAEKSPVAFVPITSIQQLSYEMDLGEKTGISKAGGYRAIPSNHKLEVTVSLTLPESDYNQNLGIFQVRVDLLDVDGNTLASSRRPCMLQFISQPIRLLLTLFKVAPILTGFTSETQDLKINFQGFTEGDIPTAFLRVVIEQRAQFLSGAGIPEIYSAHLILESELPLLKNVLWFWKKTLFIWISMAIFITELFFALLCCKPIIIPTIRMRQAANRDPSLNNLPGGS